MGCRKYAIILLTGLSLLVGQSSGAYLYGSRPVTDTDRLGMALEYFRGEKYQEALQLFRLLDRDYELNARYKAYIGLCHYHLWQYEQACHYLDTVMPKLSVFAPHEQSVYYFANGESHFSLQQYPKAIPCYEQMLNVCHDNEKADAFYRLGFCYLFAEDWLEARDYFASALAYYKNFGYQDNRKPRLAQLENMIKGCQEHISVQADTIFTADSTMVILYEEN